MTDTFAPPTFSNPQDQYNIVQQFDAWKMLAQQLAQIGLLAKDPGRISGPVVIPNAAQVRLLWGIGNGKTVSNVLHGAYSGTFTPTVVMANSLQTSIAAALTSSNIIGQLHSSTQFIGVGVRDISAAHTTEFVSTGASTPGTGTGTALPPQTSLVVTLRTGQAGQAGRGRVYLPGWASVADQGNGVATPTATAAGASFVGAVSTALGGTGVSLIFSIAHPARAAYTGKTGTAHPARAAGTVPVTAILVENNVWDTQRRRSEP